MSNLTWNGACPDPFWPESQFPPTGGYVRGRACATYAILGSQTKCCVPCPFTDHFYPDRFNYLTDVAGYLNIGGVILCIFLLVSFSVLPAERTRRHALNASFLVSIVLLELGFIVPLASHPDICHNKITVNDIGSSLTCAWAGALVVFGGLSTVLWVLARALSMHLQIVWDISPGRRFTLGSQIAVWVIAGGVAAATLVISGASFRFGSFCHPNHKDSLATFWGPIMAFAGAGLVIQILTFAYCLHIYILSALIGVDTPPAHSTSSSTQLSYDPQTGSLSSKNQTRLKTKAIYRRVLSVLNLQWRGLVIVLIATFDVIFFCIVFVVLDEKTEKALKDPDDLIPWALCMVRTRDKNQCFQYRGPLALNETLIIATLVILASIGYEAFILICRFEILGAWWHLIRSAFGRNRRGRGGGASEGTEYTANGYDVELLKRSQVHSRASSADYVRDHRDFNDSITKEEQDVMPHQSVHRGPILTFQDEEIDWMPTRGRRPARTGVEEADEFNASRSVSTRRSISKTDSMRKKGPRMPYSSQPPVQLPIATSVLPPFADLEQGRPRADTMDSLNSERRYQAPKASFASPRIPAAAIPAQAPPSPVRIEEEEVGVVTGEDGAGAGPARAVETPSRRSNFSRP